MKSKYKVLVLIIAVVVTHYNIRNIDAQTTITKSEQVQGGPVQIENRNNGSVYLPSGIQEKAIGPRIDNYVNMNKTTTTGMSIAIFDEKHVIYKGMYGYSDKENGTQVDKDTVFEWGSVSKVLVWISVMQLYERGLIDLDADIRNYLPDGFLTNVTYDKPITMLHLMNHNAGFQETVSDIFVKDDEDVLGLDEQLQIHMPLQIYEPGTITAYSNWGTALASYIVECITKESYDSYVHKNIFSKLDMNHTAIRPDLSDNEWVRDQRSQLQCYTVDGESMGTSFYHIPLYSIGMCTSTLDDFLTFARSLLVGEGEKCALFDSENTLSTFLSPTSYYGDTDVPLNCHGLWTLEYKVQVIGHGGNTAGCSSYVLIDPISKIGTVVMTNQKNEYRYNNIMVGNLIYGQFSKSKRFEYHKTILDGIYGSARTIKKGPISLYQIYTLRKMTDDDKYQYFVDSKVGEYEKYTTTYGDMIKVQLKELIPMIVTIGMFILANVYSVIILLGGGGYTLIYRIKKYKNKTTYEYQTSQISAENKIIDDTYIGTDKAIDTDSNKKIL